MQESLQHITSLPAASGDSRNLTHGSIFAEAETAHAKIAHIGSGTTADHAAVVFSNGELGGALLFDDE
jgi:hypothetical protein